MTQWAKRNTGPLEPYMLDAAGLLFPKYFQGFDGKSMRQLNPLESLKVLKPEGAKGVINERKFTIKYLFI